MNLARPFRALALAAPFLGALAAQAGLTFTNHSGRTWVVVRRESHEGAKAFHEMIPSGSGAAFSPPSPGRWILTARPLVLGFVTGEPPPLELKLACSSEGLEGQGDGGTSLEILDGTPITAGMVVQESAQSFIFLPARPVAPEAAAPAAPLPPLPLAQHPGPPAVAPAGGPGTVSGAGRALDASRIVKARAGDLEKAFDVLYGLSRWREALRPLRAGFQRDTKRVEVIAGLLSRRPERPEPCEPACPAEKAGDARLRQDLATTLRRLHDRMSAGLRLAGGKPYLGLFRGDRPSDDEERAQWQALESQVFSPFQPLEAAWDALAEAAYRALETEARRTQAGFLGFLLENSAVRETTDLPLFLAPHLKGSGCYGARQPFPRPWRAHLPIPLASNGDTVSAVVFLPAEDRVHLLSELLAFTLDGREIRRAKGRPPSGIRKQGTPAGAKAKRRQDHLAARTRAEMHRAQRKSEVDMRQREVERKRLEDVRQAAKVARKRTLDLRRFAQARERSMDPLESKRIDPPAEATRPAKAEPHRR